MAPSMRRVVKDQAALRRLLPPNYLFASDENEKTSHTDDLSQLIVSLTGPEGTPYYNGLWQMHLKIPPDYPRLPPTAAFRTRIFHPNIREETGEVCLETLKRDWDSKLTLKDILITISCLLIHPNPDSALNEKAGALLQEDYEAFARQARLMTKVHASIPSGLREACMQARNRGDEAVSKGQLPVEAIENTTRAVAADTENCKDKSRHSPAAKRPLDEVSIIGHDIGEDVADANQPKRKSLKSHAELTSNESHDEEKQERQCDKGELCPPSKFHSDLSISSKKVVWKTHLGRGSNRLRATARLGIRRL